MPVTICADELEFSYHLWPTVADQLVKRTLNASCSGSWSVYSWVYALIWPRMLRHNELLDVSTLYKLDETFVLKQRTETFGQDYATRVTWSNRGFSFHSNLFHSKRVGRRADRHLPGGTGDGPVEGLDVVVLISAALAIFSHLQGLVNFLSFVKVVKIWDDNWYRKSDG